MEVISKDKPKGKAYSINKKMKKAKRLEEEKKFRRLTENKRKNAENRKERAIERAEAQRMLIISIEGKEEKRAPLFDKKKITKKNIEDEIDNFEIKLYGSNWKISILEGYEDIREQLIWEISELL